jgi:HSP20 family protein
MFLVPMSRESRQLSRLFDDSFERFFNPTATGEGVASRSPALDVAETDRAYTVKLEVPGVNKEDVKVAVEGRQVTVQAQSQHSEEKKDGERVVYRERSLASYARTFTLPQEVDQAESVAKLEQGVLTLTLPKRGARGAAQLTVS